MATLEAVLSSKVSEKVTKAISWKSEVNNGKVLFEITGQVPSPSKDFVQLKITDKGVLWRRWAISIRGVIQGFARTPQPTEIVLTHADFKEDLTLQTDIERFFGSKVLVQVRRIIAGNHDNFSRLPESVLLSICLYLDLSSLNSFSLVNSLLREVCNSEALWEGLYRQHQGSPSKEVVSLAAERGWKTVFFMNKLQLQKEVSRQRRLNNVPSEHSDTFLTQ